MSHPDRADTPPSTPCAPDAAVASSAPAITSRHEFTAAVAWAFARACASDARRIVCVDRDFAAWPLEDRNLHLGLASWLRQPQRKLVLLAADFGPLQQRHPRFVAWRGSWAHAVDARCPPEDAAADLPSVLFDDVGTSLQLIDGVHWRGRAETSAAAARLWSDRIDAVLQRSEPAWAVKQLGL